MVSGIEIDADCLQELLGADFNSTDVTIIDAGGGEDVSHIVNGGVLAPNPSHTPAPFPGVYVFDKSSHRTSVPPDEQASPGCLPSLIVSNVPPNDDSSQTKSPYKRVFSPSGNSEVISPASPERADQVVRCLTGKGTSSPPNLVSPLRLDSAVSSLATLRFKCGECDCDLVMAQDRVPSLYLTLTQRYICTMCAQHNRQRGAVQSLSPEESVRAKHDLSVLREVTGRHAESDKAFKRLREDNVEIRHQLVLVANAFVKNAKVCGKCLDQKNIIMGHTSVTQLQCPCWVEKKPRRKKKA